MIMNNNLNNLALSYVWGSADTSSLFSSTLKTPPPFYVTEVVTDSLFIGTVYTFLNLYDRQVFTQSVLPSSILLLYSTYFGIFQ